MKTREEEEINHFHMGACTLPFLLNFFSQTKLYVLYVSLFLFSIIIAPILCLNVSSLKPDKFLSSTELVFKHYSYHLFLSFTTTISKESFQNLCEYLNFSTIFDLCTIVNLSGSEEVM